MSNYDEMWKMIEKYQFDVNPQLLIYVSCVICKKILIDAFQGKCGCSYCKNCIENYATQENVYCPGGNEECTKHDLSDQNNIGKDIGSNIKVSRLEVKCPSASCSYQSKLIEMPEHIRVCDKKSIFCPFNEIGCNTMSVPINKMSDHLLTELFPHSKILIELILTMKNEMSWMTNKQQDVLKMEFKQIEESTNDKLSLAANENQIILSDMKTEIRNNKMKIDEMNQLILEMERKNHLKISLIKGNNERQKIEVSELRNKISKQDNELKVLKDIIKKNNNELQKQIEEQETKIDQSRNLKNNDIKQLQQFIKDIHDKIGKLSDNVTRNNTDLKKDKLDNETRILQFIETSNERDKIHNGWKKKQDGEIEALKKSLNKCNNNIELRLANEIARPDNYSQSKDDVKQIFTKQTMSNIPSQYNKEFEDHIKTEPNDIIHDQRIFNTKKLKIASFLWYLNMLSVNDKSEDFYSSNKEYKMRLYVYPKGCGDEPLQHLSIEFVICNGPSHTSSRWPIKCEIIITIDNQENSDSKQVKSKINTFDQTSNYFQLFHFHISDLESAGLMKNFMVSIECDVILHG